MIANPNGVADDARRAFTSTRENRLAVETTVDYLGLPASTLTPRPDSVHITVTDANELSHWQYTLGGEVTHTASVDGAALWTLDTNTPTRGDGSTVAIHVHAIVVDGDDVMTEVRRAVSA